MEGGGQTTENLKPLFNLQSWYSPLTLMTLGNLLPPLFLFFSTALCLQAPEFTWPVREDSLSRASSVTDRPKLWSGFLSWSCKDEHEAEVMGGPEFEFLGV